MIRIDMRQFLTSAILLCPLVLAACTREPSATGDFDGCIRPVRNGCFVSMYELVSNPEKHVGKRVEFVAFYAPAFGRPTLFLNKEGWGLSDTPSAVVISQMSEDFYHLESEIRFSHVRASGVIGISRVKRIEPHISLDDVFVQPITESGDLSKLQAALELEAKIGFTEEELRRLDIEKRWR